MLNRNRLLFAVVWGVLLPGVSISESRAATYYVASGVPTSLDATVPAAGVDAAGRGSITSPFKTIQYGAIQAKAGDTVIVRNGTYTENVVIGAKPPVWVTTAAGTGENARIVFKAENTYHAFVRTSSSTTQNYNYYNGCFNIISADPHSPLAYSPAINWAYLATQVPYIIGYIDIQGFDLQSNAYNGLGINCGWAHHIRVINNRVHDSGSGGIGTGQCDYIVIDGNTVYNNCRTSTYNSSGISLLRNVPYDQNSGYHNQITHNTIYGNYIAIGATTVPGGTTLIKHTDGNGIIIDSCAYDLGTLIQNNVVYNNGGPGILLDGSPNVDIFNNTCYKNSNDTAEDTPSFSTNRGEIVIQQTTWAPDYDANGNVIHDGSGNTVSTANNPLNKPSHNVRIRSNICVPKDNYTTAYAHNFYGLNIQNTSVNCDIENNWAYRSNGGSLFYYGFRFINASFPDDPDFPGTTIGSNYGVPLNGFPKRNQTLTGTPWSGNITADPLFAAPGTSAAASFILQSGSLCRDRAWNQAGDDRDGNARPYGGYDLGAYEYRPVTGSIALEGVTDLSAVSPGAPVGNITFAFRTPGSTTALFSRTSPLATTGGAANGVYALDDVPYGTYDVAIKGSKSLRVVLKNMAVGGSTVLPNVTLPGSDANGDNAVDIVDFGILINAYGSSMNNTGSGYNAAADFDYSGTIDVVDFGLLVNAYGSSGDI